MKRCCRCSSVIVAWAACAATWAQDPVKVGPDIYKTVLDNESVRVCEIQFKPGAKVGMHSHPDHLVYVTSAGKLKLSYADGKTRDLDAKVGEALFMSAETHAAENVGGTDVRGIVVELKSPASKSPSPAIPADRDAVKAAPGSTKVAFENERVRVIELRLKPGAKLPMHSHPANVVYALSDAKAKYTTADGKSEQKEMKAGQAVWSGPVTHEVENTGRTEAHVVNIEFKDVAPAKKGGDKAG